MNEPAILAQFPPDEAAEFIVRHNFSTFVQQAFAVINPGTELIWDPFLDLICSRLQAVAEGRVRRLIITLPPRHLKSICVSVALPAFFLGHNPAAEVMCVSYNDKLAKAFGDDTRAVMTSPFYTSFFDTRLAPGKQSSSGLRTTQRGARRATSMRGTATGVGADHPGRLPLAELAETREQIGEAVWATQHMQRPTPAGGQVVNTSWLKRYVPADLPETFDEILQSWDTASSIGDKRDWSVCTAWGAKGRE